MGSESPVSNSFLILNVPKGKAQDNNQMKPPGAVSWVSDHFFLYTILSMMQILDCIVEEIDAIY